VAGRTSPDDFTRWTRNRSVTSLGSNDGAEPLAFQTWHKFKEAFPPELVAHAINGSGLEVKRCLDPFGGSGTTALTCQMLGIESTTVEVNPFFADVIRAKVSRYNTDALVKDLARVRRRSRNLSVDPKHYFSNTPKTFLEPGVNDRWIFNIEVAERLAALLTAIHELEEPDHERFFKVILGGIVADVSNAFTSGKGRRYRRNWSELRPDPDKVSTAFATRVEAAIMDIQSFRNRPNVTANVIQADARSAPFGENYELAVFSPPYPNSFDYTDVYNLELWMLGYLTDASDNRELRSSTLSSHVQLLREYAPAPQGSNTLDVALSALDGVKQRLWNRWIPSMVGAYFADMVSVLDHIGDGLVDGGQCWIVVGDSSYAGIPIPVGTILGELMTTKGWAVKQNTAFRQMRSSVQQGWLPSLAESLLVVERAS
jgi:hypothetical protein